MLLPENFIVLFLLTYKQILNISIHEILERSHLSISKGYQMECNQVWY